MQEKARKAPKPDMRLEKHPRWIKDRTLVKKRRQASWWRNAIFERDNYTCQLCNSHGGRLNAHHKMPVSKHPEYQYEMWNGMTLCLPCHKEVHSISASLNLAKKNNVEETTKFLL